MSALVNDFVPQTHECVASASISIGLQLTSAAVRATITEVRSFMLGQRWVGVEARSFLYPRTNCEGCQGLSHGGCHQTTYVEGKKLPSA